MCSEAPRLDGWSSGRCGPLSLHLGPAWTADLRVAAGFLSISYLDGWSSGRCGLPAHFPNLRAKNQYSFSVCDIKYDSLRPDVSISDGSQRKIVSYRWLANLTTANVSFDNHLVFLLFQKFTLSLSLW